MKIWMTGKSKQRGVNLLEVLVGIAIFALGMMALVQLQGSLARSSGDASARTVAVNLAEETIEAMRAFSQVTSDGVNDAFNDIVTGTEVTEVGGVVYNIARTVTDYYYQAGTDNFGLTRPAGVVNADMKRVVLNVSWETPGFATGQESTDSLGSGNIKVTDLISSITSPSGGKVVLNATSGILYGPPVDYSPGSNPEIIAIQLGANKFKESTTPLPDVIRQDELVETRFDVVTYSQDESGALFLRREEFLAVSCECELEAPDTPVGRRPTVWDGTEYTEGDFASKAFGSSANNQQSVMCDVCCRDHHDGGIAESDDVNDPGRSLTNPFRDSADYFEDGPFVGDHKHYNRNQTGTLSLVTADGSTYVEACRLIRKDGFFRVAHDFRQEGLNSFPADYLDDGSEISEYSEYVTGAVTQYETDVGATNGYENSPPSLTPPGSMTPAMVFPASSPSNASLMPDAYGAEEQQLRSRGIYVDYLSDALRTIVNCFDMGGDGEDCDAPEATSALEVLPFFDVQLTWLARWNETPTNLPVNVSNEAIRDDNSHSRGMAAVSAGTGYSDVDSGVHFGNLGFTGTDPVDPYYSYGLRYYNLHILANSTEPPPPVGDTVVDGLIQSAVGGVKASDVEIAFTEAQCDRTSEGFECYIETDADSPTLTVSNYEKANKVLLACSEVLTLDAYTPGPNGWSRFFLPTETTHNADIVIRENSCG